MPAESDDKQSRGGWQVKTEEERLRILSVVRGCGSLNCSWKRTAAMLGVNERTLHNWRSDDPSGKLDIAHEVGKGEAGKVVFDELMDRAKDPDAPGSVNALIHLSKSLCNMRDKSTQTVVTPSDLSGGDSGSEKARRRAALAVLGLEALAPEDD